MTNTNIYFVQTDANNFYKSSSVKNRESILSQSIQNESGQKKHTTIIVGHLMGADKKKSSNLYATKMTERGFITLAIESLLGKKAKENQLKPISQSFTSNHSAQQLIIWVNVLLSTARKSMRLALAAMEVLHHQCCQYRPMAKDYRHHQHVHGNI